MSHILNIEEAGSSEILAYFYQTARRHIAEEVNLHIRCCEKLKSYKVQYLTMETEPIN